MKQKLFAFCIIIAAALVNLEGARANSQCTNLLSGNGQKLAGQNQKLDVHADKELQVLIQSDEKAIRELMKEYSSRLGPFQDPFAIAYSVEQGDRIFQRLLVRAREQKWVNSPLTVINTTLKIVDKGPRAYNRKLVLWLLNDVTNSLHQTNIDRVDLQSNLVALKYANEYLRRYKEPDAAVDRDGKSEEPKKEEPKKQQQQPKPQPSQPPPPPEYPELPKEYKPFTKETPPSGDGKQPPPFRLAEVNFKTALFGQRYFSVIVRGAQNTFQMATLPMAPATPAKYHDTGREMIIRTLGRNKVDLFLPPLFKPLQPSDPRAVISRTDSGGYVLETSGDMSEVQIPLTEDNNISMLSHVRDFYTRPVGFRNEEWPELIQAQVLRKFTAADAANNPLVVAKAISNHIATEYLYSSGARPETDPVGALKAGAFQCDMAAYAMVGILRDVYQIPSRVVGGYRAKSFKGGKDGKSYLTLPGEAHAWVEVFHNGQWHLYDPTPMKKDKKDNNKGESEYGDNALDNQPKPKPEPGDKGDESKEGQSKSEGEAQGESQGDSEGDQQSSEQGEGAGKNKGDENKKRLEEDTKKRTEAAGEKSGDKSSDKSGDKSSDKSAGKEKGNESKDSEASEGGITQEELANQLELGSLELEPTLDRNPILERAARVLLQIALDPTKRGQDTQGRLNQINSLLKRFSNPSLKAIYQEGLSAHEHDHPELKNWIDQLIRMLPAQDLNKSYQDLAKIILALRAYSKVLDRDGSIREPVYLLKNLEQIRSVIGLQAHPDSQNIGLVHDLVKNLPAVVRVLLKQQYDLSTVGPNPPTLEVARKLKAGQLNDLRLLSILGPLSDFILNSTPRPETIEVKTWQKQLSRPMGRDLLPVQRLSELPRAILGQPGKSALQNFREGTAYLSTRRQRVQIPAGYGKEESERITVILYDTSGSMGGDPARFQAGLISAFTAKALSDVAPSGKHRHRVLIVPFDTVPGKPVRVTNTPEALDVIRNYQDKLKNTGGGTDIQSALMQALSLIADAEKRAGEPLAAANIVLMTDGQAEIDTDKLINARKAIDRDTPIQTMFIAINNTNEDLMRFAMDSQSMGAERGFYREFSPALISDILNQADHLKLEGRKDFFTEKSAKDLPQHIFDMLDQSYRLASEFSDQVYYGSQYISARENLEELEKIKWRDIKQLDRPLETWILKVRQFFRNPAFVDRKLVERIVADLVKNFERLSGVSKNELSDHEQEQLRHLVRYAAGLEGAD